jgi:hypothetical protein
VPVNSAVSSVNDKSKMRELNTLQIVLADRHTRYFCSELIHSLLHCLNGTFNWSEYDLQNDCQQQKVELLTSSEEAMAILLVRKGKARANV